MKRDPQLGNLSKVRSRSGQREKSYPFWRAEHFFVTNILLDPTFGIFVNVNEQIPARCEGIISEQF
jgi:hypothetical protein